MQAYKYKYGAHKDIRRPEKPSRPLPFSELVSVFLGIILFWDLSKVFTKPFILIVPLCCLSTVYSIC